VNADHFKLVQDPFPSGDYSWFQLAFVVDDLEAAALRWVEAYGIGPFYVLPANGPAPARYRGEPSELDVQIAVTQAGPVQIELVHQRCDNPSVFRDVYASGQAGVHHIATMTGDFDAAIVHYRGLGYEPVTELHSGMGRVAFVDTFAALGLMTEVVERDEGLVSALVGTARVCASWDGSDPIRVLGRL
jgi:Glyoxalase/Bleomycin resistance protein/Dioxygenase superfamily